MFDHIAGFVINNKTGSVFKSFNSVRETVKFDSDFMLTMNVFFFKNNFSVRIGVVCDLHHFKELRFLIINTLADKRRMFINIPVKIFCSFTKELFKTHVRFICQQLHKRMCKRTFSS